MASTVYDEKPKPGDLIEIFRVAYQHWAVYVGNGYIVHLAPPPEVAGAISSSVMSVLTDRAIVKKEKLWDVVGTDQWKINNNLDSEYNPRPVHVIVKEAYALVGTELPYSIFSSNCEHFVNELRYGKAESRQVREAEEAAMAVGVAAAVTIGIVALAGALTGDDEEENENTQ